MDSRYLMPNRPTLSVLLCLIFALISLAVAQGDTTCSPPSGVNSEPSCVCQTDAGQIIDLRPLSESNGKAKFTFKDSDNAYTYTYNPCKAYTDGDKCPKVYMCQHAIKTGGGEFTIAQQDEQIYKEASSGKYYVKYGGPESRVTKVYLNCDQFNCDGKITSITQPDQFTYKLQLHSCHACPGGCPSSCHASGKKKSVPAGIIGLVLIVVIIVSLVAYFIIGAILMKVHFHASGSDIIPNKAFWTQFPLLIKDGFVFTFGPCFKCIGEKTGMRNEYQKI